MKRITASQYQTSERYYKLPKLLFESERYKNMKLEVKVVKRSVGVVFEQRLD
ncbi:replication initiator protein [Streptococcus pneumoniae]|nr:replication initiator protein [Streptococcus pneumoniae]VMM13965.1 replication initiator protein [Streptococcus pneumoniae]VMP73097.1 replication initiator protein [Streptococcus pneumoniae]VMV77723.1 replication initiator protein [Streptococcus pneumoniae]